MIEKMRVQGKAFSFLTDALALLGATTIAILTVWGLTSFMNPIFNFSIALPSKTQGVVQQQESPTEKTFFDDRHFSYMIGTPMSNWDEKRQEWLKNHPSFAGEARNQILLVTGSQSYPCENAQGDHILLRFFKNKVDYCRIHGIDIFYNNVLLNPKMFTYWAKYPVVRAAMVSHPETEWIWWVDSDAVFTDMEFKLPLEKYKDHNLVVYGWPQLIYEKKSWVGLNAGVFLIRNCQWSMDLLQVWASMGPQTPNFEQWGKTLRATFKDKLFAESDDQSGLSYLLLKENAKWGDKIYIENEFYFQGYFLDIIDKFDQIAKTYKKMERNSSVLQRPHAEKVTDQYGELRMQYMKDEGYWKEGLRRPFITHFTGCEPCSGSRNPVYSAENCSKGIEKALNFADNQVLRNFGFSHPDLLNSSFVSPLPFHFTA